jgi:hypothetical protein
MGNHLVERLNQINLEIASTIEANPVCIELIELLDEKYELISLINEELKNQKIDE